MSPAEFSQIVRRRPFEPFRIEVSDGTTYEIKHPELVMVGLRCLSIGIPAVGQPHPVVERIETVSLGHVVKPIPLEPAKTSGNGQ